MQTRFSPGVVRDDDVPFSLVDLAPPHGATTQAVARSAGAARKPGTIICVRVETSRGTRGLTALLSWLRINHPACSLALWVDRATPQGLVQAVECASEVFVRAITVDAPPTVEALRGMLTDTSHLAQDVIGWCRLHGMAEDPVTLALLTEIGRDVLSEFRGRSPVANTFSPSGVRSRFRRHRMPPPAEWQRLFAALGLALELQRGNRTPLLRFALDRGYSDHSSLSRMLKRLFQVTPLHIRATLGWEWLVHRWHEQQRDARTGVTAVPKTPPKWHAEHRVRASTDPE